MTDILGTPKEVRYSDYHVDGLLDIFIGLGALLSGLLLFTDMFYLIGIIPATLLPAWQAARKVTLKRQGIDEIPGAQQDKTRLMILFGLFLGVLAFLAVLGLFMALTIESLPSELVTWIGEYSIFVLGALIAGLLAISGWLTGIHRMFGYAALLILFLVSGEILGLRPPITITVFGLVITAWGIRLFVLFTREYPKV